MNVRKELSQHLQSQSSCHGASGHHNAILPSYPGGMLDINTFSSLTEVAGQQEQLAMGPPLNPPPWEQSFNGRAGYYWLTGYGAAPAASGWAASALRLQRPPLQSKVNVGGKNKEGYENINQDGPSKQALRDVNNYVELSSTGGRRI